MGDVRQIALLRFRRCPSVTVSRARRELSPTSGTCETFPRVSRSPGGHCDRRGPRRERCRPSLTHADRLRSATTGTPNQDWR